MPSAGHSVENGVPRVQRVAIETHGCKLNQADSQTLAEEFWRAGCEVVDENESADLYIVNTCTVTHIADRKARQALRTIRRRNPGSLVVATGCYAQRSPAQLQKMDGVDVVLGNEHKDTLVQRVLGIPETSFREATDMALQSTWRFPGRRTRATVKIQEGCDQVCAYCIIPKVRGRERSIPVEEILNQVKARVQAGYREVVLTGTQLGTYGFDLYHTNLRSLVECILLETAVERIRISSLQPQEMVDGLIGLWSDDRLCPNFHVPLQSGSDRVLRLMRRRYTTEDYREAVERIRSKIPNASVTTDVILGFPGELDRDFQETKLFCESINFASIHLFPFSARPGTSAAYMKPEIQPQSKKERMQTMLGIAARGTRMFWESQLNTVRPVLWERVKQQGASLRSTGLTDTYIPVYVDSFQDLSNRITGAVLEAVDGSYVRARLTSQN